MKTYLTFRGVPLEMILLYYPYYSSLMSISVACIGKHLVGILDVK